MLTVKYRRPAAAPSRPLFNDEGDWEWQGTGLLDSEGDEIGAYVCVGQLPDCRAWDCDPLATVECDPYDLGLDLEDGEGDWQVLALDRYGDRMVNANW